MFARGRLGVPLLLTAGALLTLGTLLLLPRHVELPIIWLSDSHLLGDAMDAGEPLWWVAEDLANAALFLPLGYLLTRVLRRPALAVLLSAAISAACELAQTVIPNRDGSLIDVVCNVLGAIAGAALAARRLRRLARSADAALPADGAGPVDVAGQRHVGLHAVEADGAVRGVEGRVVVRRPVDDPVAGVAVLGHGSSIPQSTDAGAHRTRA